ncbi:TetR family transcriptional regulator [Aurantiacibacter sp. MUD11]|uniref:TetR family transcriptional regulator n=1 Tax=Aurantiacibacter sp. MUD11 TaxID=3003265 RepID=UPI0022AB2198|nr:TetR family transcriptional regulator [Aurantiacibacter sp. MUD11]WAT19274.1 TetR family transcriptional regulator [Aurantiacibacter sp. MUD11]
MIKAAGAELFATRGYRATGVRDIADRAGCNQALVSYHFNGKGGLYDEILADAVAEAERLAQEGDLSSAELPEIKLVRILSRAIASQPHLAPMILREQMDPDRLLNPDTANTLRSFMALTEKVLDTLPLDAEARGWDPQIVHLAIVGPLIHFTVATQMREATVGKLSRPMSTPDLDIFTDTLASMLSRALRGETTDR